jgi:hypothetical protein
MRVQALAWAALLALLALLAAWASLWSSPIGSVIAREGPVIPSRRTAVLYTVFGTWDQDSEWEFCRLVHHVATNLDMGSTDG